MLPKGLVESIVANEALDLVAEVEDGEAALDAVRRLGPDVAVLDMRLPGLDGIEVLRAVKEGELNTKILLLSAHLEGDLI